MGSADSLGADQRAQLYRTKLTSLVRSYFSADAPGAVAAGAVWGFGGGAVAALADRNIVLVEGGDPIDSFGVGLVKSRTASSIDVWVDARSTPQDGAGVIARQGQAIGPVSSVQRLADRALEPAIPAAPVAIPADIGDGDPWVGVMRGAGLDVGVRDGAIIGTLRGLEAARIGTNYDGTTRLDVGVGYYDQEAFAMMNADLAPDEALAEVVRQITELRVANAASHPINRLGRTRWLADTIVQTPALIGVERVETIDILPDPGIRNEAPVALRAADADGQPVAVVVAVGLDPGMVPAAADTVVTLSATRCVLVVPERDHYPLLDEMATMMTVPTTVQTVPVPW